eukprot:CAMPEP_0170501288 /NCGR_PEP_ID=MMETSP0208-20121228/37806_1 /TAXON_ID=197538 /ORGANISM="Strombidium inclinatum, Strain S3" /LENGTH=33 /DNA_ID= /DNA_START= /DNA_END= /DNA_ORIENTATION=
MTPKEIIQEVTVWTQAQLFTCIGEFLDDFDDLK